jgi:hypothetical protein
MHHTSALGFLIVAFFFILVLAAAGNGSKS